MKKTINDRLVGSLKAAAAGKRYDVMDTVVPGFGVRVTDTGNKTYIFYSRLPGVKMPSRRAIGPVGSLTLPKARQTARDWSELVVAGVDPKKHQAKQVEQAERVKDSAFVAVAEDFIAKRLGKQRKGEEVARDIRRDFGGMIDGKKSGPWKDKQIDEIEARDVVKIIEKIVDRGAEHQARNSLGYIRRVFDWAVVKGKIKYSPCAAIKPKTLLGAKQNRDRILSDTELRAVWHEADKLGYPFGAIYQLLILFGLRLNEVADARHSEFDMKKRLWVIPAARMKNKEDHVVPLCDMAVAILESLPRWNAGDCLFSTTGGKKPVYVSDKIKKKLDNALGFSDWRNHDLRRTMRTNLSPLPIHSTGHVDVRELMIAHKLKGISGVYNKWEYLDEKRTGFELWCAKLASIVVENRVA